MLDLVVFESRECIGGAQKNLTYSGWWGKLILAAEPQNSRDRQVSDATNMIQMILRVSYSLKSEWFLRMNGVCSLVPPLGKSMHTNMNNGYITPLQLRRDPPDHIDRMTQGISID